MHSSYACSSGCMICIYAQRNSSASRTLAATQRCVTQLLEEDLFPMHCSVRNISLLLESAEEQFVSDIFIYYIHVGLSEVT